MNRADLPASVLARLIEIDEQTEFLARRAQETEAAIASSRARLSGPLSGTGYDEEGARLRQLLADLPQQRGHLETARGVLSSCRVWLADLPDGTVLEPVAVQPDGRNLAQVRQLLADLDRQRRAIESAPPPPAELTEQVRAYVADLAARGGPTVLVDGRVEPRWGERTNFRDPSRRPHDWWALLCWLDPEAMVARMQQAIALQATDLQMLSRDERERRLREIAAEVEQLCRIEEALLAPGDRRRPGAPPAAVLGVRIVPKKTSRAA